MTHSKNVISYITLGVTDLPKLCQFYSALGFTLHSQNETEDHPYVFYKLGSVVLALYPKHLLAFQSGSTIEKSDSNKAMSISLNVKSKVMVDELLLLVQQQEGKITREGFKPCWGGYCAYFKDPENNLWEIVWNEKFVF